MKARQRGELRGQVPMELSEPGQSPHRRAFVRWATRSFLLTAAAVLSAIVGWVLIPALSGVASVGIVIFLALALGSFVLMVVRAVQWVFSRSKYYRGLPATDRTLAYTQELRSRGAPEWYIGMNRRTRLAYIAGVFVVAAAVALIRPFPGDSQFGLRMALFGATFLMTIVFFWRIRGHQR